MRVIQEKMFANVEEIAESVQKAGFDVQLADVQVPFPLLSYTNILFLFILCFIYYFWK